MARGKCSIFPLIWRRDAISVGCVGGSLRAVFLALRVTRSPSIDRQLPFCIEISLNAVLTCKWIRKLVVTFFIHIVRTLLLYLIYYTRVRRASNGLNELVWIKWKQWLWDQLSLWNYQICIYIYIYLYIYIYIYRNINIESFNWISKWISEILWFQSNPNCDSFQVQLTLFANISSFLRR